MLRAIPLSLLELREVFNQLLHVFNRLELRGRLLFAQELLHVRLDAFGDLSKVFEHDLSEEFVIMLADDHFRLLKRGVGHHNSVVLDADELMDHGLVCPLVQQRCDRVLSPVKDQHCDWVWLLHTQLGLQGLGNAPAQGRAAIIPDQWVRTGSHKCAKQAFNNSSVCVFVGESPLCRRVDDDRKRLAAVEV